MVVDAIEIKHFEFWFTFKGSLTYLQVSSVGTNIIDMLGVVDYDTIFF